MCFPHQIQIKLHAKNTNENTACVFSCVFLGQLQVKLLQSILTPGYYQPVTGVIRSSGCHMTAGYKFDADSSAPNDARGGVAKFRQRGGGGGGVDPLNATCIYT